MNPEPEDARQIEILKRAERSMPINRLLSAPPAEPVYLRPGQKVCEIPPIMTIHDRAKVMKPLMDESHRLLQIARATGDARLLEVASGTACLIMEAL